MYACKTTVYIIVNLNEKSKYFIKIIGGGSAGPGPPDKAPPAGAQNKAARKIPRRERKIKRPHAVPPNKTALTQARKIPRRERKIKRSHAVPPNKTALTRERKIPRRAGKKGF